MDQEIELQIVRRAYAKQILAVANVAEPRIEAAFAHVPRERYVGPGPWPMFRFNAGYVRTPSADPVYLYTDQLVGLVPERYINNGQPSLHAVMIASVTPAPGEHVVHVGAGSGYYTAILAHLVGPKGRVTAYEFDGGLAEWARANLAPLANVRVVHADATTATVDRADVIYVSAGMTYVPTTWLDGLADGGRLLLPLGLPIGFNMAIAVDHAKLAKLAGHVFRIERRGEEFHVRPTHPALFIPAEGAQDDAAKTALAAAFQKGDATKVTRLYRRDDIPEALLAARGGMVSCVRLMRGLAFALLAQ